MLDQGIYSNIGEQIQMPFHLRLRRKRTYNAALSTMLDSVPPSTPPTEQKVQIAVAVEYKWDKAGDLIVNNITANQINGGTPISKLEGLSTGFTTDLNGSTNYQKTITVTGAEVGDYVNAGLNNDFQTDLNGSNQNYDIRAYVSATNTVIVNTRIDSFLAADALRKVWVQIIK